VEFVNGATPNDAVPVLLAHLDHDYPYRIKEGIARSLTSKRLPPNILQCLIKEFQDIDLETAKERADDDDLPDKSFFSLESYKFALGIAIGYGSREEDYETLVALVRDRSHGAARYQPIHSLARKHRDRAADVLLQLLPQDDVLYPVLDGLAYLRDGRARAVAEKLAKAPRSSDLMVQDLRTVAKKYLKRIGVES